MSDEALVVDKRPHGLVGSGEWRSCYAAAQRSAINGYPPTRPQLHGPALALISRPFDAAVDELKKNAMYVNLQ